MVVSPDSKFVYVTNFITTSNTGIVQVIDTGTNTITATITVGTGSVFPSGVAITPDGQTLYVADEFESQLWVIDTATQEVTTTLNVFAKALAVSPDGTQLYVCNGGVSVSDTANNQITNTIQFAKTRIPWDVVFTPNGKKAYVSAKPNGYKGAKGHAYIAAIDETTESVVSTVLPTGHSYPGTEVLGPNARQLFYSREKLIQIINTSSEQVVRTLRQNFSHGAAVITPDGKYLYMVSAIGGDSFNDIVMVDVASGNVVGKPIGLSYPLAVAIAPNGKFAYVFANISSGGPGGLYVVDISSL